MSSCCKAQPFIDTVAIVAASGRTRYRIPKATIEFVLQVRTAVGATVAFSPNPGDGFFSIPSGASYTEERLGLTTDLDLWLGAAADCTVEVWRWEG